MARPSYLRGAALYDLAPRDTPGKAAMLKERRLASLADALGELASLEAALAAAKPEGPWSLAHVLHHVAASIEYTQSGYPKYRPALVRATIGALALRFFLARGVLTHDHAEEIPGAPPPPDD